jgi:glucose/arabinose dehydrogenase
MVNVLLATVLMASQASTPGVTMMAWQLESPFERVPNLVNGQAPNAYFVHREIAFRGDFPSEYGVINSNFYLDVSTRVAIAEEGRYDFLLESQSPADLRVQGETVTKTWDPTLLLRSGQATGQYLLARGSARLQIRVMHNEGPFAFSLKWRPPGAKEFTKIPDGLLSTEAGQTFVTSPGVKKANLGKPSTAPGDARPLESVHPSFQLVNFRGKFAPAVGGMCFLPDGRLAVCTWDERGAVYLISGLDTREPKVKLFAEGLGEPLGIAFWKGDLYVTQKGEVTRLRDVDGDGTADEFMTVASGWPVSQNYHEFTFNLVPYQGSFYVTSSVPLRSGNTNYMPGTHGSMPISDGPGSWIKIDPETGKWEILASGLRTPNGMAVGVDGEMFVADNQGSWLPSSVLYILKPGTKYLHQVTPDGKPEPKNLVVWFPHGEIGNSPSQMTLVSDGPYRGQMLIGDVTHGGLKRIALERVNGDYQGAVFRHSQGLEAGVNRLAWGEDGSLYVGGVGSNGNWNHLGHRFGLQRLKPTGKVPFEMHDISARKDGFVISFTNPISASAVSQLEKANVRQWRYESSLSYGGPKIDDERLTVKSVQLSLDGKQAFFELGGLKAGHVVYFNLRGLTSAKGSEMWSPEGWYTISKIPNQSFDGFASLRDGKGFDRPRGAETLIDGQGKSNMVDSDGKPSAWKRSKSYVEVVHDSKADIGAGDAYSKSAHGDAWVHVEWYSPAGGKIESQTNGNSGIKLQSRYEIQIMNRPGIPDVDGGDTKFNEAGSIYRQTPPSVNASFGAGVWQSYDIWFRAAQWKDGKKVDNARATVYWNGVLVQDDKEILDKTGLSGAEGPEDLPMLLQDHHTEADGPVRYRNVWMVKDPWGKKLGPPDPKQ